MGTGKYARKKQHKGKKLLKQYKTKLKTKDLDEIHEDLTPAKRQKIFGQEPDPDLPGSGQNYCITCAEHFVDLNALKSHMKSKRHKKRMKSLSVEPYTQEEADRAAGMGSFVKPKKVTVVPTQVPDDMETGEDKATGDDKKLS